MRIMLEMDSTDRILAKRKMGSDKSAHRFFASTIRRHCDKYVPMLSGTLKQTAQTGDNYVLYDQPYARANYLGNAGKGLQGTSSGGLRGKEWDKRMMASEGKTVLKELADYVGGKAK